MPWSNVNCSQVPVCVRVCLKIIKAKEKQREAAKKGQKCIKFLSQKKKTSTILNKIVRIFVSLARCERHAMRRVYHFFRCLF